MKDVRCPYCDEYQEIDHDDGYGYDENELYNQECSNCEKTFAYTTYIIFNYESYKADCLNEGDHEWEQMRGAPTEFFVGKYRCRLCGEKRILEKEKSEAAIKAYVEMETDEKE